MINFYINHIKLKNPKKFNKWFKKKNLWNFLLQEKNKTRFFNIWERFCLKEIPIVKRLFIGAIEYLIEYEKFLHGCSGV